MSNVPSSDDGLTQTQVLLGLLALAAADREERIKSKDGQQFELRRTELVLSDAGLSAQQIATLLAKKPNSVARTITRSRSKAEE